MPLFSTIEEVLVHNVTFRKRTGLLRLLLDPLQPGISDITLDKINSIRKLKFESQETADNPSLIAELSLALIVSM